MPGDADQTVQLNAASSAGQLVKTYEVVGIINGVVTTYQLEAITVTDKTGQPLSFAGMEGRLDRVIELLEDILEETE